MDTKPSMGILRRDCPHCGREGMAAATLCGYCWSKLTPLPADSPLVRLVAAPLTAEELNRDSPEMRQYRLAPRRSCPRCGREIMAAATLCGYCWEKLEPLTTASSVATEQAVFTQSTPPQSVAKPAQVARTTDV